MGNLPLEGLKVVDIAVLFASPTISQNMGDFGADVIKVEHPRSGDSLRSLGAAKNGIPLWWKITNRNKKCVTLDLSKPEGQEVFKQLIADADVLTENFRPGTMEKWGLGWEVLHAINPRLVFVRVSGFGQTGPYKEKPGFGTLAEAMSGFAYITGQPDGPPTLPGTGLADAVAGQLGTWAVMFALYERDHKSGTGQYVDLSVLEPLFTILGDQAITYDQLGKVQQRTGNRVPSIGAPRNIYKTKDGRWLALSANAPAIATRVFAAIGQPDLINDPRFTDNRARIANIDEVDAIVGGWIAERTAEEALKKFDEYECACAPVYNIADIFADPHFQAREAVTTVQDPDLGPVRMQNVVPKLSRTPGKIRWPGPTRMGQHNEDIYCGKLGISRERLAELKEKGVI
ncbi:MAG: CaiB/BaiF CoA transferase family protein [Candidatus Binatia bacterium]